MASGDDDGGAVVGGEVVDRDDCGGSEWRTRARPWVEASSSPGPSSDAIEAGYGLNALAVTQWALGDLDVAATHTRPIDRTLREMRRTVGPCGRASSARPNVDRSRVPGSLRSRGRGARSGTLHRRPSPRRHRLGPTRAPRPARRVFRRRRSVAREALAEHEVIGYDEGIVSSLHLLGRALLAVDDPGGALSTQLRALRVAAGIGHAAAMCEALEEISRIMATTPSMAERAAEIRAIVDTERRRRRLPRRDEVADVDAESEVPSPQGLVANPGDGE